MSDKAIITEAANRYGVRPDVLWGLYGSETSFGKDLATSSAGAVGPFQFLPSTARSMGVNPNDFKSAAFGAARYLAQYKGRGIGGMLSAYNAGPAGGYQSGYVEKTLANARSYGSASGSSAAAGMAPTNKPAAIGNFPGAPRQVSEPDAQGLQRAKGLSMLARLISSEKGSSSNPLLTSGLLSTKEPLASEYTKQRTIPGQPARQVPGAPPAAARGGTKLGGFLSASAPLQVKRIDQGQDIQTRPGEGLLAPGDGEVIAVKSDPSGFGPDYPVVKFSSGPLAGQSVYLGHTDSSLRQGERFRAGQAIARTSRTGHNAPPGWAEIGMASALGQGIKGQGAQIAPYLGTRKR